MIKTPKSLRLQIGIFGRTNVGKSTFLNCVAGQDVAITSPVPGTTTDVVEKTMELLPVGPVVFLDTAGLDDISELSPLRLKKTKKMFDRADVFVLITEPEIWGRYEEAVAEMSSEKKAPLIIVINKCDEKKPSEKFIAELGQRSKYVILCSSVDKNKIKREEFIATFKKYLLEASPDSFINNVPLIRDLVKPEGIAVLIIPIDYEAPKGRIILPQVQAIRDSLDGDAAVLVVKEHQYKKVLSKLNVKPDIVVCDSQVVDKMINDTPKEIACTTFSILLSRYRGDIIEQAKGGAHIHRLKPGDRILVAESCSHHPIEDDIGRVKMPRWLAEFIGGPLSIDTCSGSDYPANLSKYKLIIHCGACMIGRKEMLSRLEKAKQANVPVTNYGIAISVVKGVIEKVLSPFPEALKAYAIQLKT